MENSERNTFERKGTEKKPIEVEANEIFKAIDEGKSIEVEHTSIKGDLYIGNIRTLLNWDKSSNLVTPGFIPIKSRGGYISIQSSEINGYVYFEDITLSGNIAVWIGTEEKRIEVSANEIFNAVAEGCDIYIKRAIINEYLNIEEFANQLEKDKNGKLIIPGKLLVRISEIQGNVFLRNVNFKERVDFIGVTFRKGYVDFQSSVFSKNANFSGTFIGKTNFSEITFRKNTTFNGSTFISDVRSTDAFFRESTFCGNVSFINVNFYGRVDFFDVTFKRNADFKDVVFNSPTADFRFAEFKSAAMFQDVKYWSDSVRTYLARFFTTARLRDDNGKVTWWDRFVKRVLRLPKESPEGIPQKPTQFYLDNQNIDEVSNPTFKRYVADHQFIRAFKEKHRWFWYPLWFVLSDCGRSFGLWLFWSLIIALSFGKLYETHPTWFQQEMGPLSPWYFSIVTFTTLGFGDLTPKAECWQGQAWVMAEVILGYIMLGGLISIFANKFARRS